MLIGVAEDGDAALAAALFSTAASFGLANERVARRAVRCVASTGSL